MYRQEVSFNRANIFVRQANAVGCDLGNSGLVGEACSSERLAGYDPLAELVKIDPQNIGVGLYQHDVNAKQLKESLGDNKHSSIKINEVKFVAADPATGEISVAAQLAAQSLGPLQVTVGSSNNNSAITFPGGSSTLRLANSSAQPWDSSAILYITNWHGSAVGGGQTQLYFGSNASGLTSQQLAQIKFNVSGRLSAARMLPTGEVVPQQVITYARSGDMLTLTWGPGWTLQSSINVTGLYQDVQEATSPRTVSMDDPSRFFRLRQ